MCNDIRFQFDDLSLQPFFALRDKGNLSGCLRARYSLLSCHIDRILQVAFQFTDFLLFFLIIKLFAVLKECLAFKVEFFEGLFDNREQIPIIFR